MKNLIKSKKNVTFDAQRKLWVVSVETYKDIIEECEDLIVKENAKLQDIPRFAIKLMKSMMPFDEYEEISDSTFDYTKDKKVNCCIF